jgi:hypothetical protein
VSASRPAQGLRQRQTDLLLGVPSGTWLRAVISQYHNGFGHSARLIRAPAYGQARGLLFPTSSHGLSECEVTLERGLWC